MTRMSFLCRVGMHRYREHNPRRTLNRYFECTRCSKRIVVTSVAGYQPINQHWLDGGMWNARPLPPPRKP
jgi:hypothetical protein